MKLSTLLAAAAVAVAGLAGSAAPSQAGAFFGWEVTGVPSWDLLNVRAYPSSQSRILVGYPNGVDLSLTGTCTDGVDLEEIGHLPHWRQREIVRRSWCEVWVDPTGQGDYRTGWVYGRYIRPL